MFINLHVFCSYYEFHICHKNEIALFNGFKAGPCFGNDVSNLIRGRVPIPVDNWLRVKQLLVRTVASEALPVSL